jgi:hypothetical protein
MEREETSPPEGPRPTYFDKAHDVLQAHYRDTRLWRIFEGEKNRTGWIRNLHQMLTDCSHDRPGANSIEVWEGHHGPVYLKSTLDWTIKMWVLSYASCLILLRLIEPSTPKVNYVFSNEAVARVMGLKKAAAFLWETEKTRN